MLAWGVWKMLDFGYLTTQLRTNKISTWSVVRILHHIAFGFRRRDIEFRSANVQAKFKQISMSNDGGDQLGSLITETCL